MCGSGARCRCGRAPLLRPMGCNIRARQRVGGRDRGCMHDSWKIYTNEAADCRKEVEALRARREASVLVRKHLASELDEARRRVELAHGTHQRDEGLHERWLADLLVAGPELGKVRVRLGDVVGQEGVDRLRDGPERAGAARLALLGGTEVVLQTLLQGLQQGEQSCLFIRAWRHFRVFVVRGSFSSRGIRRAAGRRPTKGHCDDWRRQRFQ